MDLPVEIRDMIYDYALMVPGQINPYPTIAERKEHIIGPQCERPSVALLQVSKQVREEAQNSLYGKNVWVISCQTTPSLPRAMYDNNARLFRHVTMTLHPRDVTREERILRVEQVKKTVSEQRRLHGRVYTPIEEWTLLAAAYQEAFVSLISEKFKILDKIQGFGNLCSMCIDASEVRNPMTGHRTAMFQAMSDAIHPKFWGDEARQVTNDEGPWSRSFMAKVLRDPRIMTKGKPVLLLLKGVHPEELQILTRRAA
ncbi:MAG: hypothetical protein Q9202_007613 [Teloschistes flavicans]